MLYLGKFRLKIFKNIVMFEINTLEFVKIEFLDQTVNFGIWYSFSKGPSELRKKIDLATLLFKIIL